MSGIGLVWNPASPSEAVGHNALQGVGTLRVEGKWDGATAKAGGASWRLLRSRQDATATDAAGRVVGDYRDRARTLRWNSRTLQLRRPTFLSRNGRYALADGEQILALLEGNGAFLRPVNVEVTDLRAVEPGLLLFVSFLGGWLAARDENNDGL